MPETINTNNPMYFGDIVGDVVRETASFVRAAGQMVTGAEDAIGVWLTTVAMEPDSIKTWLEQFGNKLVDITTHRNDLRSEALMVGAGLQIGSFPPSLQIRQKMADRMGESEGGLAWALKSVLLRLADIHEALRQSLAAHLNTDLDNMKIIDKVRNGLA